MERIELPQASDIGRAGLAEAIMRRRSVRRYSGGRLTGEQVATLLLYSCGLTDRRARLRASPSAGATYPLEMIVSANNVEGLDKGVYRYSIADHTLAPVRQGDASNEVAAAALGQRMLKEASVVLAITAVPQRIEPRYADRSPRYMLMEAGHIAQNACLVAAGMGLGTCPVGAFRDEELNRVLGLDGRSETALYLVAVGTV